jgi:superfamily II DNA/RNA helicase/HEPN domain-containing protein
MSHSDSTFFTNEPGELLIDRFKKLISGFQYFDILVGYFRISGFYMLYDELEKVDKIRILVGIDADKKSIMLVSRGIERKESPFASEKAAQQLLNEAIDEMAESEDTLYTETGARKFIEFLRTPCKDEESDKILGNNGKKMEIRVYPENSLHAKVYIGKFPEDAYDYGRVITGSSNFSYSGLKGRLEFNVELKQKADYDFAKERFDELWGKSTDISEVFSDTIIDKTWLDDSITPYELYLKMLYEYFKEELSNTGSDDDNSYLPEGFKELEFQKQAVSSAYKVLNAYGGVFLADVVGLGKTYMAALLAQRFSGRHLVICPPTLKSYWEDTFREFGIKRFDVESMGKLDSILHNINSRGRDYVCVFVDEAHRFRNEFTQGFELLHRICANRKVVLVSATPLNNRLDDIFNLLKLFQKPHSSTIPGVSDLDSFFGNIRKRLSNIEKSNPEYIVETQRAAQETRDKILRYVMVRRTRSEITRYYAADIAKQGVKFPEVASPDRIIYRQDKKMAEAFGQTINAIKSFRYARYTPLRYMKESETETIEDFNQKQQQQYNIGGFMKMILVKRLESSIYAFRNSVTRFIASYVKFISMFERGKVIIGQKSDIYNLLDEDDETISLIVEAEGGEEYDASKFKPDFKKDLHKDLEALKSIRDIWEDIKNDPKLDTLIYEMKINQDLSNQQIVIFTESKETGEYVQRRLEEEFPKKSIFFSASGGLSGQQTFNPRDARLLIQDNFDPKEMGGDLLFLVTTDVLSEGINLHRAGRVINYDLPWNPTRILQRVGRINRIGSIHDIIRIYNFFPTDEQEQQIGLEKTIKAKLQSFHDALGEDAKYLSDEEIVGTYTLFGETLYNKINNPDSYAGDIGEKSELEYLQIIRDIRKDVPQLYAKIEALPQKARSGRFFSQKSDNSAYKKSLLITFFRQGSLKKFIGYSETGVQEELNFLDAVDFFKCDKETERIFPDLERFYEFLSKNKEWFASYLSDETQFEVPRKINSSARNWLMNYISAITSMISDLEDKAFLASVRGAISKGTLPNKLLQRIKKILEKTENPYAALDVLKKEIPSEYLQETISGTEQHEIQKQEVILSEWLNIE